MGTIIRICHKICSLFIISIFLGGGSLSEVFGQNNSGRSKFLPKQVLVQFAGNIGFIALGSSYGNEDKIYSRDYFWGYVPYYFAKTEIHTLSFKNKFRIKKVKNGNIYAGVAVSFETGRNSTLIQPDFYPSGYYMTNSFYFPIFLGISMKSPIEKKYFENFNYYVETGTIADYIYYTFLKNKYFDSNIFSFAFGLRYTL